MTVNSASKSMIVKIIAKFRLQEDLAVWKTPSVSKISSERNASERPSPRARVDLSFLFLFSRSHYRLRLVLDN